jgi:hypothetical protein
MTECSRREFFQRVSLVASALALGNFPVAGKARAGANQLLDLEAMEFLKGIAAATVKAAHVPPGAFKIGGGVNTTGIPLIIPGGSYPAFWVRDYAMSLDCGLIGPDEMLPQLKLIAHCQSGPEEHKSMSGATIPPFSIPDRIQMDGAPVIVALGMYQPTFPWGPLPPADNHFYFIHIAWAFWRDTKDAAFLNEQVDGLTILDRLIKAFHATITDPQTGAVVSTHWRRMIGFGFQDSIVLLGAMCFATLLRWRAAKQLADLCRAANRPEAEKEFQTIAQTIADNIMPLFSDPKEIGGWLRAATKQCRQPDVWATLFALHLGVLPPEAEKRARDTVAKAVAASGNVIEYQGAVRHVPTTHDFSDKSAWEKPLPSGRGKRYQNGAYWHTPTGWLIQALKPVDPSLAKGVFDRFIAHLREYDYRKKETGSRMDSTLSSHKPGAPWECFGINLDHAQNPVYMTSVTLPLSVLQKMNG